MLKLVKREDIKQDAWIKPDGLDYCLDVWKDWMGRADTDLGIKGQVSMRADGGGNNDTAIMRRDNEIAEATDAMIDSLKMYHRAAIYRKCGISQVWAFPNANFIQQAEDARAALTEKLRTNVATRTLF